MTSAYKPDTDGCCERANRTIIEVLRKHTQEDKLNWDLWLPFVEFAYNTRVHSITKFSPYRLLFGVEPNDFTNYIEDPNQSDIENVFLRSIEIRELTDYSRFNALKNIEKGQEVQKRVQNNRTNPTEEPLEVGTQVMVKIEGNKGKLDSLYFGRFIIKEQLDSGNYKLTNALGEELNRASQYAN
jgi:hypothetical protein